MYIVSQFSRHSVHGDAFTPAVVGDGSETQSEGDEEEDDEDGQDTGAATADSDNTVVERDLNDEENGGAGDETEEGEVSLGILCHELRQQSCKNVEHKTHHRAAADHLRTTSATNHTS